MADLMLRLTPLSHRARTTSHVIKYHRWQSSEFFTTWAITVASFAWNKVIIGLFAFLYYKSTSHIVIYTFTRQGNNYKSQNDTDHSRHEHNAMLLGYSSQSHTGSLAVDLYHQ